MNSGMLCGRFLSSCLVGLRQISACFLSLLKRAFRVPADLLVRLVGQRAQLDGWSLGFGESSARGARAKILVYIYIYKSGALGAVQGLEADSSTGGPVCGDMFLSIRFLRTSKRRPGDL